jgi:hypothetical protein
MVASPFYHRLHILQLRVMHRLTGEAAFARVADRWESYTRSRSKRTRPLLQKRVSNSVITRVHLMNVRLRHRW